IWILKGKKTIPFGEQPVCLSSALRRRSSSARSSGRARRGRGSGHRCRRPHEGHLSCFYFYKYKKEDFESGNRFPAPTPPSLRGTGRACGRRSLLRPAETGPGLVVVLLQLARAERELRRAEHPARLPHEGEAVAGAPRGEHFPGRFFPGRVVRAVRRHGVVQR